MRLTEEEKDDLRELVTHPGWEALLKHMAIELAHVERALLSIPLEKGPEEVFAQRAKTVGAQSIYQRLESLKEVYRRGK